MQLETLESLLKEEQEKMVRLSKSDLAGERVLPTLEYHIAGVLSKLSEIEDPQQLLDAAVQALRNIPGTLSDLFTETTATRREQSARVSTIRKCIEVLKESSQPEDESEEEESTSDPDASASSKPRKVGERPEQLKKTREAGKPKKEE